jgi:hypothetical protein
MRGTSRSTALAPAFLVVAVLCGCVTHVSVRRGGVVEEMSYDEYHARRFELVREQARSDLPCAGAIEVRGDSTYADIFFAEGCGRRVLYRPVDCGSSFAFIPISQPISNVDAYAGSESYCTGEAMVRLADKYIKLSEAAARDLPCPRERVDVWYVFVAKGTSVPVAKGCGKRVTYAQTGYFDPVSIVDVKE